MTIATEKRVLKNHQSAKMRNANSFLSVLHLTSALSLLALIFLNLLWEAWLAPTARVVLILKTLPLLVPLLGVLHGRRYTFQWSSMLILFYFTEGIVRAFSDKGISAHLALAEIVLALLYFFAAIFYARLSRGLNRLSNTTSAP